MTARASDGTQAVLFGGGGGPDTNIVERCTFYELGKKVIDQSGTTSGITVRNCLIFSWGGAGNHEAVKTSNTGSLVEHNTISDYQGGNTYLVSMGSTSKGTVRYNIFNRLTSSQVVQAATVDRNLFFNIGASSASYISAGSETGNIFNDDPLFEGTASATTSTSTQRSGDYSLRGSNSPAWQAASGSTVTGDIRNDGRSRGSYAAGGRFDAAPALGAYQIYEEFTDPEIEAEEVDIYAEAPGPGGTGFTILTIKNITKAWKTKLNDKEARGPSAARGPAR